MKKSLSKIFLPILVCVLGIQLNGQITLSEAEFDFYALNLVERNYYFSLSENLTSENLFYKKQVLNLECVLEKDSLIINNLMLQSDSFRRELLRRNAEREVLIKRNSKLEIKVKNKNKTILGLSFASFAGILIGVVSRLP